MFDFTLTEEQRNSFVNLIIQEAFSYQDGDEHVAVVQYISPFARKATVSGYGDTGLWAAHEALSKLRQVDSCFDDLNDFTRWQKPNGWQRFTDPENRFRMSLGHRVVFSCSTRRVYPGWVNIRLNKSPFVFKLYDISVSLEFEELMPFVCKYAYRDADGQDREIVCEGKNEAEARSIAAYVFNTLEMVRASCGVDLPEATYIDRCREMRNKSEVTSPVTKALRDLREAATPGDNVDRAVDSESYFSYASAADEETESAYPCVSEENSDLRYLDAAVCQALVSVE